MYLAILAIGPGDISPLKGILLILLEVVVAVVPGQV
jgi:hypothetical protein